jgi:hypothetical protein
MPRHVLHIAAALAAFSVSFLTVGKIEDLTFTLPLALCVFVFTKLIPELNLKPPTDFDPHNLKVAVLTLLLWIPVLAVFLLLLIPQSGLGNCTPDLP